MKKIAYLALTLTLMITLVACNQNEVTGYVGLNAEIVSINSELKGFTVKSLDHNSVLGDKCYINLEGDNVYYIYADNQTLETQDLEYSDFMVGDAITIDTAKVEHKCALARRIQLITQRIK